MSRIATATSTLARMATTRAAAAPQKVRRLGMFKNFMKDATEEHTWPFLAGGVITGMIVWSITPSSTSEYAKNSKFQQRCNGTYKHEH